MTNDHRSDMRHAAASCPQASRAQKSVLAVAAVVVSGTLLCSMLGLFEIRSEEAALARSAVKIQPPTNGIAKLEVQIGPRS